MDEIQVEIYGEPKSKAGNSKKNANGKKTLKAVHSNARNQWEKMLIAKGAVSLHFKITELLELLSSSDTVLFKIDNIRCCVIGLHSWDVFS